MKKDSMYRSLESIGQTGNRLANPPSAEPDAGNLHVRVCEGAGPKGPALLGSIAICRQAEILFGMLFVAFPCWASNYEISSISSNVAIEQGYSNRTPVLSARFDKSVTVPGEMVILSVALLNYGTNTVFLPSTMDFGDYQIHVSDENGLAVPLTRYGENLRRAQVGASTTEYMLPPGKILIVRFVLNRLFDLSMAGKYRVKVSRLVFTGSGTARVLQRCESIQLQLEQRG